MRIKHHETGRKAWASRWNDHGMSEIIVHYDDGDCSSEFAADWRGENGERLVECRVDPPGNLCTDPCPHRA